VNGSNKLDGCIVWNAHNTVLGTRFFKLNDLHISTSLSSVTMDMSHDSTVYRHCLRQRYVPYAMPSTGVQHRRKFGGGFLDAAYRLGE